MQVDQPYQQKQPVRSKVGHGDLATIIGVQFFDGLIMEGQPEQPLA